MDINFSILSSILRHIDNKDWLNFRLMSHEVYKQTGDETRLNIFLSNKNLTKKELYTMYREKRKAIINEKRKHKKDTRKRIKEDKKYIKQQEKQSRSSRRNNPECSKEACGVCCGIMCILGVMLCIKIDQKEGLYNYNINNGYIIKYTKPYGYYLPQ